MLPVASDFEGVEVLPSPMLPVASVPTGLGFMSEFVALLGVLEGAEVKDPVGLFELSLLLAVTIVFVLNPSWVSAYASRHP